MQYVFVVHMGTSSWCSCEHYSQKKQNNKSLCNPFFLAKRVPLFSLCQICFHFGRPLWHGFIVWLRGGRVFEETWVTPPISDSQGEFSSFSWKQNLNDIIVIFIMLHVSQYISVYWPVLRSWNQRSPLVPDCVHWQRGPPNLITRLVKHKSCRALFSRVKYCL